MRWGKISGHFPFKGEKILIRVNQSTLGWPIFSTISTSTIRIGWDARKISIVPPPPHTSRCTKMLFHIFSPKKFILILCGENMTKFLFGTEPPPIFWHLFRESYCRSNPILPRPWFFSNEISNLWQGNVISRIGWDDYGGDSMGLNYNHTILALNLTH